MVEGPREIIRRIVPDVKTATDKRAVPEDEPLELVIFAPNAVVKQMLPRIDRLVENDQPIDGSFSRDLDALLTELTRTRQATASEDKSAKEANH
jgi:hypothetical protein